MEKFFQENNRSKDILLYIVKIVLFCSEWGFTETKYVIKMF